MKKYIKNFLKYFLLGIVIVFFYLIYNNYSFNKLFSIFYNIQNIENDFDKNIENDFDKNIENDQLYLGLKNNNIESKNIWINKDDIKKLNTDNCGWLKMYQSAELFNSINVTIENQDSNNNVQALASAIVYLKTGDIYFKNKVINSLERLINKGKPNNDTLSWAREIGAYVMAAEIVGYHSDKFNSYLENLSKKWVGNDGRTLTEMYYKRPNNWGMHAFASLLSINLYLGNNNEVIKLRNYYLQNLLGPKGDEVKYGKLYWHIDESNPLLINPVGSIKKGKDISGYIPEEMRRGGEFKFPPEYTGYPWEFLQGLIVSAYILERQGLSIWESGDKAILRAVKVLQEDLQWKAKGDDEWLLLFIDDAYGTNYSKNYNDCDSRIYKHGKNAGWGWILGN